jgi:Hg(II)-responsive transcriptional regulator
MKPLMIGQVASQSGVAVETIRFYERQGLLEPPERRASGYRQYDEDVVTRIRFIRRAKELGFSLTEIDELLKLRVDSADACAETKRLVVGRIEQIDDKIRDLQRVRNALSDMTAACDENGSGGECPILDALARYDLV